MLGSQTPSCLDDLFIYYILPPVARRSSKSAPKTHCAGLAPTRGPAVRPDARNSALQTTMIPHAASGFGAHSARRLPTPYAAWAPPDARAAFCVNVARTKMIKRHYLKTDNHDIDHSVRPQYTAPQTLTSRLSHPYARRRAFGGRPAYR